MSHPTTTRKVATTMQFPQASTARLRSAADQLDREGSPGFRRKTSLEHSPESDRIVMHAVARAKEGDPDAVRYLYLRYSDNVYGYVRSIVRDDHEAEDVTQHVFAKLMTVVHKYEERSVPFTSWVLRLAHNCAIDHLRTRRATPCEEVRGPDEQIDGEAADRAHCLRTAIASLPEDQRNVIVLRHLVGLTPGEIAERLGRSESSVHGLHHRGRGALCAELREMQLEPTVLAAEVRAA